jgi:hypothetical protein
VYQYTTHYVGDASGAVIGPGAGWLLIQTVSLSPQRIACVWHKPEDYDEIVEWGATIKTETPSEMLDHEVMEVLSAAG